MTDLIGRSQKSIELVRPRVFELRVDVTSFLEGELPDWPPNIQDGVYLAMERMMKQAGIKKVFVLQSRCGRDVVEEPYHVVVTVCEDRERELANVVANGK